MPFPAVTGFFRSEAGRRGYYSREKSYESAITEKRSFQNHENTATTHLFGTVVSVLLEIREKVLGENHPDVATTLENMAGFYKKIGKQEEAVSFEECTRKIHVHRKRGSQYRYNSGCLRTNVPLVFAIIEGHRRHGAVPVSLHIPNNKQ